MKTYIKSFANRKNALPSTAGRNEQSYEKIRVSSHLTNERKMKKVYTK
jgi:hypothetical protein